MKRRLLNGEAHFNKAEKALKVFSVSSSICRTPHTSHAVAGGGRNVAFIKSAVMTPAALRQHQPREAESQFVFSLGALEIQWSLKEQLHWEVMLCRWSRYIWVWGGGCSCGFLVQLHWLGAQCFLQPPALCAGLLRAGVPTVTFHLVPESRFSGYSVWDERNSGKDS